MPNTVTRDENATSTTVDAIIEVKTAGFVPDKHNQSIEFSDCNEVFAIFGKPYGNGGTEYALVAAGEYGEIDLDGMAAWLRENEPEKFNDLLLAMLESVDEEELDEALELTGWNENDDFLPDVAILIDRGWLDDALGEEAADELLEELNDALEAFLDENGHGEFCFGVTTVSCEGCCTEECGCCAAGEDDDAGDGDVEDEDGELPWDIEFSGDVLLDDEGIDALADGIEEDVILPILQKYGLVKVEGVVADEDDGDSAPGDN
jgi:hypothetical protein